MANLSKEQNTHDVTRVISAEQVGVVSQKQLDAAAGKNQGTSFVARLLAEQASKTLQVS